jgi:hypothetical protein
MCNLHSFGIAKQLFWPETELCCTTTHMGQDLPNEEPRRDGVLVPKHRVVRTYIVE